MQPILEQEKLFFELTKSVMSNNDTSQHNFIQMSANTYSAFEFMKKLLAKGN